MFLGVQREISTGALPWGKISPMSTRDKCQDSVCLIDFGVRSLLLKIRDTHTDTTDTNSMVVDIHHGWKNDHSLNREFLLLGEKEVEHSEINSDRFHPQPLFSRVMRMTEGSESTIT